MVLAGFDVSSGARGYAGVGFAVDTGAHAVPHPDYPAEPARYAAAAR